MDNPIQTVLSDRCCSNEWRSSESSIEVGVGGGALIWKVSPPPASNEAVKVFQLPLHSTPSLSHLPPSHFSNLHVTHKCLQVHLIRFLLALFCSFLQFGMRLFVVPHREWLPSFLVCFPIYMEIFHLVRLYRWWLGWQIKVGNDCNLGLLESHFALSIKKNEEITYYHSWLGLFLDSTLYFTV